jgi:hypothetical protein
MGYRESRGNSRRSGIVGWRSAVSLSLGAAAILLLSAAPASATWSHYFNLAQGDHVGYYLAPRVAVPRTAPQSSSGIGLAHCRPGSGHLTAHSVRFRQSLPLPRSVE